MRGIHICCFTSGLEDLSRKEQADLSVVLRFMRDHKRFSCFEASANPVIARTMTRICQEGFIRDIGGEYPWTNYELTDKGMKGAEGLFWHGPEEDPMKDFVQVGKGTWVHRNIVERRNNESEANLHC